MKVSTRFICWSVGKSMSWVDEFKLILEVSDKTEVGPDKVANNLRNIVQSANEVWRSGRTAILIDNDIVAIENAIMWLDVLRTCMVRAREKQSE